MLKNNMFYEDKYMYFTFNEKYSKEYNLYIQNSTQSVPFFVKKNTTIDFISPQSFEGQYALRVSNPQSTCPLDLVGYGLTRQEIIEVMTWLKAGVSGLLIFDYAKTDSYNWAYDVIISDITEPVLNAIDEKHFIVSWKITFVTNGCSYPHSNVSIAWNDTNSTIAIPIPNGYAFFKDNRLNVCFLDSGFFNYAVTCNTDAVSSLGDYHSLFSYDVFLKNKKISGASVRATFKGTYVGSTTWHTYSNNLTIFLNGALIETLVQDQTLKNITKNITNPQQSYQIEPALKINKESDINSQYFYMNTTLLSCKTLDIGYVPILEGTASNKDTIAQWLIDGYDVYACAPYQFRPNISTLKLTVFKEAV